MARVLEARRARGPSWQQAAEAPCSACGASAPCLPLPSPAYADRGGAPAPWCRPCYRSRCVTGNLGLAGWAAKKMRAGSHAVGRLSQEEAYSAGVLGLVVAAGRFRPECGVLFSSYAYTWVRQQIQLAARVGGVVSVPYAAVTGGAMARRLAPATRRRADQALCVEALSLPDDACRWLAREDDPARGLAAADAVERLLALLTARERQAVRLVDLGSLSFAEAAPLMGVSKNRVWQLHTRGMQKLRLAAEEMGDGGL